MEMMISDEDQIKV